jgi:hypothetical protein
VLDLHAVIVAVLTFATWVFVSRSVQRVELLPSVIVAVVAVVARAIAIAAAAHSRAAATVVPRLATEKKGRAEARGHPQ